MEMLTYRFQLKLPNRNIIYVVTSGYSYTQAEQAALGAYPPGTVIVGSSSMKNG